jgi:branched-chain amino acid transport system ATP-binding protein
MILEVNNLEGYYGLSQILFGINLEVEKGDSVCLIGRNGVGKTTTLKSIVGQLNPKVNGKIKGSIKFDGTELVGMPSYKIARLGIAYVPQGRHIFPTLTVKENLLIAERVGVDGDKTWTLERIYELFPRLKERENSKGEKLSGGEQQMLTIARGLMQNPKLLIMDEIIEGLAPIIVEELVKVVSELRNRGITILLAEQSLKFALEVSHKCYIIEKGEVVYKGVSSEIPKEVFVKYLGT